MAVLFSTTAFAQSEEENAAARQLLLNSTTLECTFTIGTQTDWVGENAPSSRELPAPRITLTFDRINAPTSSATLKLDGTETDVFIFFNRQGLNIMERAGGGAISLYTIFGQFAPGSDSAFMAVNSRHAALAFPFPSQRHGTCQRPAPTAIQ
ncbi:MAG: hypothetical protein ACPGOV_07580 [Magnetovibrionaceae bacterium]